MVNFIVVTGGVISGIGKGITASSIGVLFQARGLCVTAIKIDPYLNVDAGTMSPFEHGECFVLDDGGEVDLDLGNYERFLSNVNLTKDHSITTGKVYKNVINAERNGRYLGKTVQIIPHITDEIERLIELAAIKPPNSSNLNKLLDICIIEIGGTIGDIEGLPFVRSIVQMSSSHDKKHNFCFVHVSATKIGDDCKTKPTQNSVATLMSLGIKPDVLIMRTPTKLNDDILNKLVIHCGIDKNNIINNIDVPNIYFVPNVFEEQDLFDKINNVFLEKNMIKTLKTLKTSKISKTLNIDNDNDNVNDNDNEIDHEQKEYIMPYKHFESIIDYYNREKKIRILTIAGKYIGMQDTYLSLLRAIEHAAIYVGKYDIKINWIDTEKYNGEDIETDCIIIPGGFGNRGIDGKLAIAKYARLNKIPILGICLGMQVMVIEYAKNVCGILNATSSEWNNDINDNDNDNIVDILSNQEGIIGGTMRLGNHQTILNEKSYAYCLYEKNIINERHRHRYEVNNKYVSQITDHGLIFSGKSDNGKLMEIAELPIAVHPFYIGCQFHPEFKTKHDLPHPLFIGLLSCIH